MNRKVEVHYYDRGMDYTGCGLLPNRVEAATAIKSKVTCQKCLDKIEKENK